MVEVDARDARIAELEAQVAERDEVIARPRAQVEALKARVAELEARLNQNSSNSSRPPSSDAPGTPRQRKKPTGRRRPGGQPGHKKHERALLPPEDVQHVARSGCCRTWTRRSSRATPRFAGAGAAVAAQLRAAGRLRAQLGPAVRPADCQARRLRLPEPAVL